MFTNLEIALGFIASTLLMMHFYKEIFSMLLKTFEISLTLAHQTLLLLQHLLMGYRQFKKSLHKPYLTYNL